MIRKELPIKITFSEQVQRPKKLKQHLTRVRVSGPADEFPEELQLNADEIAEGGELTIDDLTLPDHLEITDNDDSDPIVTIEYARKDKRVMRGDKD